MISNKTASAGKRKFPGLDYTYCSGNQCNKKDKCFRCFDNYDIPEEFERFWILDPKECIKNDYSSFIEIN